MYKKFMKIDEFAHFCKTTRDALIWYDKVGVLKPELRGENGYRYYSPEQMIEHEVIITLKETGSTLREIKSFYDDFDFKQLKTLIESNQRQLEERLEELEKRKRFLESINESLNMALSCDYGKPEIISQEEELLITTPIPQGHGWLDTLDTECLREHIIGTQEYSNVNPYPNGSILTSQSLSSGRPEFLYHFYTVAEHFTGPVYKKPSGLYVQIFRKGDYNNIVETLNLANNFIQGCGYRICGEIYKYDLITSLARGAEDNFVFRFLIPITAG